MNYGFLHDSGKNWCNEDDQEVGMLLVWIKLLACFHCFEIIYVTSEILKSYVMDWSVHRNQAGRPSAPVVVWWM